MDAEIARLVERLEELGAASGFMEKLLAVFVSDNSTLLARMEQAMAGRNYAELRSLMHAMKGSSASMGTDRLTAQCAALGRMSDAELRLQGAKLVRSLGEEFAAARGELERYLRTRRRSIG